MKFIAVSVALVLGSVFAAASDQPDFGLLVIRSGSPVHLNAIKVVNEALHIGDGQTFTGHFVSGSLIASGYKTRESVAVNKATEELVITSSNSSNVDSSIKFFSDDGYLNYNDKTRGFYAVPDPHDGYSIVLGSVSNAGAIPVALRITALQLSYTSPSNNNNTVADNQLLENRMLQF